MSSYHSDEFGQQRRVKVPQNQSQGWRSGTVLALVAIAAVAAVGGLFFVNQPQSLQAAPHVSEPQTDRVGPATEATHQAVTSTEEEPAP
ncbi:MAG: hypothetical protein AAGH99_10555 [Planctomycetota bacterium]